MAIWNNLTYLQKTIAFAVLALLLAILGYTQKIAPTLELKTQLAEIEELSNNETLDEEINLLKTQLHYLNKIMGKDRKDLESINREILNYVSLYSDSTQVKLVQMPRAHKFTEAGFTIYTHVILIQGTFSELLPLTHFFETETSGMKLASVRYYTKKNLKTKRNQLFAELYIQSYEKYTNP